MLSLRSLCALVLCSFIALTSQAGTLELPLNGPCLNHDLELSPQMILEIEKALLAPFEGMKYVTATVHRGLLNRIFMTRNKKHVAVKNVFIELKFRGGGIQELEKALKTQPLLQRHVAKFTINADLAHCGLYELPDFIATMRNLRELHLENNCFSDFEKIEVTLENPTGCKGLKILKSMDHIEKIYLQGNQTLLLDEIPERVANERFLLAYSTLRK
ncbi:hypothetical protein HOD08_01465 [bacterium]|jgi:hypothetical protein|nr:hypothetical protein [bacterium]